MIWRQKKSKYRGNNLSFKGEGNLKFKIQRFKDSKIQHTSYLIQHSKFKDSKIQNLIFNTPPTSYFIPHPSNLILHSSFCIQNLIGC